MAGQLEKLAAAVGAERVVGVGENLSDNRSIAKLVREGHAVISRASLTLVISLALRWLPFVGLAVASR